MELTGNVQGLIDLVGGGSDVEFEQILESGEKIGVITIDNVPTDIYAPEGAEVEVTQVLTSGTKIASIEVDGESVDLYAPTPEEPTSVEVTQVLSSGTKIATIEVDGESTDLYAPEGGSSVPDYSTTPVNTGRKWIDGTSEVKELVIQGTASQLETVIDLSAYNINNLISITGNVKTSDESGAIIFPYGGGNSFCVCAFGYNDHVLYFSRSSALNAYNKYTLILTYT